jgi:RNA recognition motif-containing protein
VLARLLERVRRPGTAQSIFLSLHESSFGFWFALVACRSDGCGLLRRINMKNLFVGNMSFQTTADDLRALFEPFGQLARVHVATDRETGRARGFGFVEMPNDAEAAKAIAALDGKDVGGRNLKVNEARPKSESGGGPRGPRGGSGSGSGSGGGERGGNSGGPRGGNTGGGKKERFSNEDYREVARQPREPRW